MANKTDKLKTDKNTVLCKVTFYTNVRTQPYNSLDQQKLPNFMVLSEVDSEEIIMHVSWVEK